MASTESTTGGSTTGDDDESSDQMTMAAAAATGADRSAASERGKRIAVLENFDYKNNLY